MALFKDCIRSLLSGVAAVATVTAMVACGVEQAHAVDGAAAPVPTDVIHDLAPISADPLPTVQMDGVAWTQTISGGKVYVGGEFTNARPAGAAPGTSLTPRTNLLAYDVQTGVLDTSWAPTVNAVVRDLVPSADGSRIFVGGQFTSVNGITRYRVAALDAQTGALIPSWAPHVNGRVDGLAVKGDALYIVGQFSEVSGVPRTRVAAVSATTGAVLPFAAEATGGYGVKGIVVSPDGAKVAIAGDFTAVNGSTNPGRGLAALDAANGSLLPWLANSVVRNADTRAGMHSISSDGDSVYSTGWDYGGTAEDKFEGSLRMSWEDGSIQWLEDCHGDSYDVASSNDTVYVVGHPHYCGNIGGFPQTNPWTFQHSLAFSKAPTGQLITPDIHGYKSYTGMQAPRPLNWYPLWTPGTFTGQTQAGWSVEADDQYVVIGGEFLKVGDSLQQGLVRFATRENSPKKAGPRVRGGAWPLSVTSFRPGQARLTAQTNYDWDDSELTYEVLRSDRGLNAPLATFKQMSTFWKRPVITYTDTDLVPGQTYRYSIRVTDQDGNNTRTDYMPVTIADTSLASPYSDAITTSLPLSYWPLNDAAPTLAMDWEGGQDLVVADATREQPGQQLNATSKSTTFAGRSSSFAATQQSQAAPDVFTVEAWFRTTSTSGGKIVGFGSAQSGNSSSYDRHIYLAGNGRVTFGVYPGTVKTISSSGTGYNDGQWHHVVGSLGPDGQTLWLDGQLVGRDVTVTSGQPYSGYWRVGGDNLGGWPNTGASTYLSGSIADVAIYDRVLGLEEIDAHRVASGRSSAINPSPADLYGSLVYAQDPLLYWRLNETAGPTAVDSGRYGYSGTFSGSTLRYNRAGALAGVSNTAVQASGTSPRLIGTGRVAAPNSFAAEAWIKTTTTTGGKVIGFGDSGTSTLSTQADRHIYLDNRGTAYFGVSSGGNRQTIASTRALNDGQWHHLVGQMSPAGMEFYVDGVLQGTNPTQTGDAYLGYWRAFGDRSWAGDTYFDGDVDEIAVLGHALTAAQVWTHYDVGRTGTLNQPPVVAFTPHMQDLTLNLDASDSTDPDGTIVSWAWDLGDGTTASGPVVQHTYAAPGTYQVTLTLRDDRGGLATQTVPVVAHNPNQLPSASFSHVANFLDVTFDGTASSDPDGSLTSYSWAFGDGAAATGATVGHSYALPGTYQVTLTVTDDRGATAVSTVQVTVEQAPNQLPVASFTVNTVGRTVSVDGSGSSDADGSLASYAWDFGDGHTATGASATHTFDADGVFVVTLTVTDDRGGTGSSTADVPVRSLAVVASDAFSRVVTGGWGAADTGGVWTGGNAGALSVAQGEGRMVLQPSWVRQANLMAVSSTQTRTSVSIASDSAFSGGVQSFTVIGRQVGNSTYAARIRIESGGVRMYILRDETAIGGSYMIPNYLYQPGDALHVELDVTGTNPTAVAGRVWVGGTERPATPNLSGTDSTPALQVPGSVGLKAASAGSSTVTRTYSFRDYLVVDPTPRLPNAAPVAAFTSSVAGLVVSVDGSGSSDADGSLASYAWDFGDGQVGTGATGSHTYAAAGTYQVSLVVTDDKGATGTVTHAVTVADTPPLAKDDFERSLTGSWGTSDTGGPWSLLGGSAAFSVINGQGIIDLAPSHNREADLNGVSATSTLTELDLALDQAPVTAATHTTVIGRRVGSSYYGGRVRFETNGGVRLYALYNETALANSYVIPNRTFKNGDLIHVKVQVSGTSPTTVNVKAWFDGDDEPTAWQVSGTSTIAAMQVPGGVGIKSVVGASSTVPVTRVRVDNFRVVQA